METYTELKTRQAKELNDFEGIFFAFNQEQFKEGLEKVKADVKEIYSLGAGGYIRKDKSKAFNDMFKRHNKEKAQRRKEEKFILDSLVYELRNHEYCITYNPQDALDALGLVKEDIDTSLLKKACLMAV